MKKLFITALLGISIMTSAFATDVNSTGSASYNFNSYFAGASDITWSSAKQFSRATFTKDNHKMEAYFDNAGELISTSTSIGTDELPIAAKRSIAKKYNGFAISEAIKLDSNNETSYYVSANNDKETVILKIDEAGQTSIFDAAK
jgi:hypothetical protein